MSQAGLLKMAELAEASGVSSGTIKHYLREGLLGEGQDIVRTSRNMAYYPPAYVERIRTIKRLQEDRFLPLARIRELLEAGDRLSREELRTRFPDVPADAIARLEAIGVLEPDPRGYSPDDVAVVDALQRFRAGGYDEALGFTVYEMLRYQEVLQPLVEQEARLLRERLAGTVEPERAAEIIAAGAAPLRDLVGALHAKLLLAELRRQGDDG